MQLIETFRSKTRFGDNLSCTLRKICEGRIMVANKVEQRRKQRKKREPPDKGNRTQSEHSGAEHNAPEQAVIVLCGTDPSASQQALHDEWAWHDYIPHPRPPSSTSSSSSHAFFSSSPACHYH
ncbi:hypothetical protein ATANTOWER_021224 [Ataeniobius toweri]|uniref:Uncharacterized protein n=1 Tax=Ataeniobius toweri TaxID=208326 RepID=A0ABU7ASN6_9TELE|nr:hypothetical protein [Ataeniobius toweri]